MPSASVTMFVMNSCDRDARVLKEAGSLAAAGYSVRVIAMLDKTTTPHELRDGFVIDRVIKDPIHYRFLRRVGNILKGHPRPQHQTESSLRRQKQRTRRVARWLPLSLRRALAHMLRLLPRHSPKGVVRSVHRIACSIRHGALQMLRQCLMPVHRPLCYFDYYIRACRLVREAPSDVYHGHDLHALPAAWWSRRKFGGKVIYDSHEIYTEMSGLRWLDRKVAKRVERFLIRRVDAVITIHDTAADELARRYSVPKPSVVRNCPRIPPRCERTTRLQDAAGLGSDGLIVLYQGGFTANRGLPNLLRAVPHLPERAKLVMMGWGKIEPELRALAAELGLLDRRIFFLPPVPQNELLYWTASADVGVIPYQAVGLNNYLCMPNKLFEYMGAGLPIVASAFPELSRIIDGNEVGLTFDPEDPKSIAEAVQTILGDADLRSRMSQNARKASLVYNWENEEKSLLEVYARVTG